MATDITATTKRSTTHRLNEQTPSLTSSYD